MEVAILNWNRVVTLNWNWVVNITGICTLTINTGHCSMESEPLEYTMSRCQECKIERVVIKEIEPQATPFCSYTYTLVIYSGMTFPYQVTLSEDTNQVVFIPSTFTLNPGQNVIQVTVIPQGSFSGGALTWTLQGMVPYEGGFENCIFEFEADVRWCEPTTNQKTIVMDKEISIRPTFTMYPNPASSEVIVGYPLELEATTLEIFDLTGRAITKKIVSSKELEVPLTISGYPPGVYLVVVKQAGTLLWQNRLLIK